jgi:lantibiotic modifying enzyme
MGAVLYAMQRSSVFLHDPEIEAAAHRLAHRLPTLTSTPWTAPQDMADGSELCLGLITLTEAELAVAWGQRLLAHWGHLDGTQRQTVVLHAPYLALCWHRLYQTTHVEAFHQAHHETLGLMHKATQDNATQDTPLYFSLLACTDGGADSVLGTWLSEQLKHLCQADLPSSDHLQSGASAVAEKLNTASHTLNRPPLRDAAQRIIGDMVRRATTMRGYQTIEGMPLGAFFPSFSQGLSGIGYALLRNQAGTSLPCVQLWD